MDGLAPVDFGKTFGRTHTHTHIRTFSNDDHKVFTNRRVNPSVWKCLQLWHVIGMDLIDKRWSRMGPDPLHWVIVQFCVFSPTQARACDTNKKSPQNCVMQRLHQMTPRPQSLICIQLYFL